jgi:hypothetical protein
MAPTLSAQDPSFPAWHRRYERYAASQDSLIELLELSMSADVRELAPTIRHPALVIHRTEDRVIPVARARELAALLPERPAVRATGRGPLLLLGRRRRVDGRVRAVRDRAVRSRPVAALRRPTVRITTLGRFAVEVDGEEVPIDEWGSRRARQLCKRLVAARGWPVTRDELFELLWPDEVRPPAARRATLRPALGGPPRAAWRGDRGP